MHKNNAALGAACVLALTLPAAAAAQTTLLVNSFFPPQHFINTDVLPAWAAEVEAATEGRVVIEFPASSLAPPPAQWDAVTSGIADGAYIFNGFAANRIALPLVAHVPWVGVDDAEAMSVALWRTYEEFFADAGEYADVQLIGLFTAAPAEFYSLTDTPVTSVVDLQSRRVWALPGTPAEAMAAVDVSVVSGPAVQIHETVSRGVVDAFVGIPFNDARAFRASDYVESATVFERKIFTPSFSMFVSADRWADISPEDQEAIMAVSGEAFARTIGAAYDADNASAREELIASGAELVAPSADFVAEMEAATQPLVDAWIARAGELGVDGEAALAYYRETVDTLARD